MSRSRTLWRREGALALGEAASASLLLYLFAPSAEQTVGVIVLFFLGLVVSAWQGAQILEEGRPSGRFLVRPLVQRAVGWGVAALPLAALSSGVPLSAAYFGFLVGAVRAVVYRAVLDRRLEDAAPEEREAYLRATLFERLVQSVDALGVLGGNALMLFVLMFMDVERAQVRTAWASVPLFAGSMLIPRWWITHRLVCNLLAAPPANRLERPRKLARALPAILALLHTASWAIVSVVALVGFGDRIGLRFDDQILVMALAALLVWGVLLYQHRWHRSTLAHLEPFLPGPEVPTRPQTLRARMMWMFGFPVLFACALSLFASVMQYRLLATRLVEVEAADRAEPIAERLAAAGREGGDRAMRRSLLRLAPPPGMVVFLVTRRGDPRRVGEAPQDFLAVPGTSPRAPELPAAAVRAMRRGEAGSLQLEAPLMTGSIVPLPGTPAPGSVAVLLPGYRGAGRLGHILGLAMFSLALALVAGGVVAWASQELAVPVRRLGQTADSIASGRLGSTVEPIAGPAELAQLARSLERMRHVLVEKIETIAELNVGLEAKVGERTRELQETNSELADALARLESSQAQLVHSEKMASLGQLVAGVAHEINNPLNFILNTLGPLEEALADLARVLDAYAELEAAVGGGDVERAAARRRVADARASADLEVLRQELHRMVTVMRTGAQRAVKIVTGLRTFSRAQTGEATPMDLHEGLEESLVLIGHIVRSSGVEVVREYGDVPKVLARSGELNQVFLNLLTNAAQSGARRIVIRTRCVPNAVEVEIADDGSGIAPEALSRIFDPFYTTKPVGSGTGLGLSISLGIVRAHDGTIEVASEPGRGTTFTVRLPLRA